MSLPVPFSFTNASSFSCLVFQPLWLVGNQLPVVDVLPWTHERRWFLIDAKAVLIFLVHGFGAKNNSCSKVKNIVNIAPCGPWNQGQRSDSCYLSEPLFSHLWNAHNKFRLAPWTVWLSWLEFHPVHKSVVSLIPGQGTYLRCGFDAQSGLLPEVANWWVPLTLMFLSFTSRRNKFRLVFLMGVNSCSQTGGPMCLCSASTLCGQGALGSGTLPHHLVCVHLLYLPASGLWWAVLHSELKAAHFSLTSP